MNYRFSSIIQKNFLLPLHVCFIVSLAFFGCSEDNSTGSEPDELEGAKVSIEPQNASLEINEQIDFSAFVISASGDTINDQLDINWNWRSSDPDVFTVENDGKALGLNSGEAYCIVEASIANNKITAKLVPIGLDSARILIF